MDDAGAADRAVPDGGPTIRGRWFPAAMLGGLGSIQAHNPAAPRPHERTTFAQLTGQTNERHSQCSTAWAGALAPSQRAVLRIDQTQSNPIGPHIVQHKRTYHSEPTLQLCTPKSNHYKPIRIQMLVRPNVGFTSRREHQLTRVAKLNWYEHTQNIMNIHTKPNCTYKNGTHIKVKYVVVKHRRDVIGFVPRMSANRL